MAGVRVEGLVKTFGRIPAVRDLTLEVRDGEFMVLVGPSGCGKTTLLNMIAGLEAPTAGRISIGGRLVNHLEPGERELGMVFQSLALFPHMSVFENIAFGLRIRGTNGGTMRRRVEEVAGALRVSHLLSKRPAHLSGGEAQRVAVARTLITGARLLLLDEPLSSLDAKLRVEMRTELKRLHARLGATFLYVTHDQEEAMTMADRIVVMREGVIQQVGSPLEIYEDPADLFVASFFGTPSMNLLEAEIAGNSDGPRLRSSGLTMPPIPRPLPAPWARGGRVRAGIRPEEIGIDLSGTGARVGLVEVLGDRSLVFLEVNGDTLVAKVEPRVRVQEGQHVGIDVRHARVLLFDPETGLRIRTPAAEETG